MANYGEKYYHTYCDRHGDTYRISLQVDGYVGASTLVECGPDQFVIDRENSTGMALGGVYPTRATATFISDVGFNLEELYSGNEKTYLLVRYRNGVMNWQGNIVADGFSEGNWDESRTYLTVKATDNLAGLKNIPFTDALGENYGNDGGNTRSFIWAIKEGLKKTGFNMNIWTFVDIKSQVQSDTFTTSAPIERYSNNRINIYFNTGAERNAFYDKIEAYKIIKFTDGAFSGNEYVITGKGRNNGSIIISSYAFVTVSEVLPPLTGKVNSVFDIYSNESAEGRPDPLLTEHDVRVWIRDSNVEGKTYYEARGGALSTWDVLDAIARQWNLIIHQNEGHWEVKRWNSDKLPDDEYQWFVYNSEGTPIGREDFGGDILIPCRPTNKNYRIFGTNIDMDRVLKNVIVNYRYKYKQDGDSLVNMIDNPNFVGGYSGWAKMEYITDSPSISATPYSGSIPPSDITTAISIKNIYNEKCLANRTVKAGVNERAQVNKGDRISISWWELITGSSPHEDNVASIFQISMVTMETRGNLQNKEIPYNLVLAGIGRPIPKTVNGISITEQTYTASWQSRGNRDEHIRFAAIMRNSSSGGKGTWRKVTLEIDEVPVNGFVEFEILGASALFKNNKYPGSLLINVINANKKRIKIKGLIPSTSDETRRESIGDVYTWFDASIGTAQYYTLTITGIQMTKIIDPDNEVVPQIDPFMYPDYQAQLTRNFSDTINEIEVLTGDDYGKYADDRISSMSIDGNPTAFWDTWDGRFGWSRQGLITAKSIIEMYWKPTRLMQCEINTKGLHWSSRIQFEELPGLRFVILRGSIGGHDSTFKGVLKEVFDNAESPLPPGGNDGGNTVTPDWQPTGTVRCIKDDDGLNTGGVQRVEIDNNPASASYGQERWVDAGTDEATCPIGAPPDILWGEQLTLDVDSLRIYPYVKVDDTYTVSYSNDGSNRYLRLLHRASLGTVTSIIYGSGFENISGWEYDPDVVIDGYTYKSMRLTWFVGVFTGLEVNFTIN